MQPSEIVRQIKRSFRLYMNGNTSRSMREKGLEYKINWGVSQVDLRTMAYQYDKNAEVAQLLWKENIRECKILATYLMPIEKMTIEEAMEWGNGITTTELAEVSVFNLFCLLPYANDLAVKWLKQDEIHRICAYHLLCRSTKRGITPTDEAMDILWINSLSDIDSTEMSLRHSLLNCLIYFAYGDTKYSVKASDILSSKGYGAF